MAAARGTPRSSQPSNSWYLGPHGAELALGAHNRPFFDGDRVPEEARGEPVILRGEAAQEIEHALERQHTPGDGLEITRLHPEPGHVVQHVGGLVERHREPAEGAHPHRVVTRALELDAPSAAAIRGPNPLGERRLEVGVEAGARRNRRPRGRRGRQDERVLRAERVDRPERVRVAVAKAQEPLDQERGSEASPPPRRAPTAVRRAPAGERYPRRGPPRARSRMFPWVAGSSRACVLRRVGSERPCHSRSERGPATTRQVGRQVRDPLGKGAPGRPPSQTVRTSRLRRAWPKLARACCERRPDSNLRPPAQKARRLGAARGGLHSRASRRRSVMTWRLSRAALDPSEAASAGRNSALIAQSGVRGDNRTARSDRICATFSGLRSERSVKPTKGGRCSRASVNWSFPSARRGLRHSRSPISGKPGTVQSRTNRRNTRASRLSAF